MSLADRYEDAAGQEEESAAWPPCRRCRRTAEPGLPCGEERCPWHREVVDGETRLIVP